MYLGYSASMYEKVSDMPVIKSVHSLTHKYVTPALWDLLKDHKT